MDATPLTYQNKTEIKELLAAFVAKSGSVEAVLKALEA